MKRILFLTLSILVHTITMSAQTFTEHLESKVAGQGTVTVYQDPILDRTSYPQKEWEAYWQGLRYRPLAFHKRAKSLKLLQVR